HLEADAPHRRDALLAGEQPAFQIDIDAKSLCFEDNTHLHGFRSVWKIWDARMQRYSCAASSRSIAIGAASQTPALKCPQRGPNAQPAGRSPATTTSPSICGRRCPRGTRVGMHSSSALV